MLTNPLKNIRLNPREVIENITLKKILRQYPEMLQYKSQIRFNHTGNKATLNLDLLPKDMAIKIKGLFL